MKHFFLAVSLIWVVCLCAAERKVYEKEATIPVNGKIDEILADYRTKNNLPTPQMASDTVWVRRVYLDLLGRLPTIKEAKDFVYNKSPQKYEKLVNHLLDRDEFADYWCMRWCDFLRVKSEFPINLWPNAVSVYQRRIRLFWKRNERYNVFAKSLLLGEGSDFRVPESNFYRAAKNRTPEGLASVVTLTFLGMRYENLDKKQAENLADFFRQVRYKKTMEWKEEIVWIDYGEKPCKLVFPDGTSVEATVDTDRRKLFANWLFNNGKIYAARAFVNRVWWCIFGRGIVEPADSLEKGTSEVPELLDYLAKSFIESDYNVKNLLKQIVLSGYYLSSGLPPQGVSGKDAEARFLSYPIRRMDAEVIEDAIRDITATNFSYNSVIPEPFSYFPEKNRTITIGDGSVTSSFLILFGRPARDSGVLDERNNAITGEQRLYFFNSGNINSRLATIFKKQKNNSMGFRGKVDYLYWAFLSRPPTSEELQKIKDIFASSGKRGRYMLNKDLAWMLLNSREFLYRH